MGPVATFVSYRLGGTDGVSIESAKWMRALEALGFTTRRLAGDVAGPTRPDDVTLPWLALGAPNGAPDPAAATRLFDEADLTVIENVCSLPLNRAAALAVADATGRTHSRVVFHHHDLPWQRPETANVIDLPPRPPGALHVTINETVTRRARRRGASTQWRSATRSTSTPPRAIATRPAASWASTLTTSSCCNRHALFHARTSPRRCASPRSSPRSSRPDPSASGSPARPRTATNRRSTRSWPKRRCRSPSDSARARPMHMPPPTWWCSPRPSKASATP